MATAQERRDEMRLDNLEQAYGTPPRDRSDINAETVARIFHEDESGWPWAELSDEEQERVVTTARKALDAIGVTR